MQITRSKIECLPTTILFVLSVSMWLVICTNVAAAFDFHTDTAHGNTSYGVNRSGAGHDIGDCAHCHETFDPSTCGQNSFMLFYDDWVNECDLLCVECHSESTEPQQVYNNPYSVNFGGYSPAYYTTIETQFCDPDSTPVNGGSRHDLDVIRDLIDNDAYGWGFGSDPDPCVACHSPHAAQRNYPVVIDEEGKLNTAIRRPSHYKSTAPENSLWGDDTGERMSDYASLFTDGVYQPLYYGDTSGTKYEPWGDASPSDGSDVPDYVTFCMDCHQNAMGDIPALDWDNNAHGGKKSNTSHLGAPYTDPNKNYVISCLDCHEPHAAKQEPYLFRKMVNGQEIPLGGSVCLACHDMGETSGMEKSLKFGGHVHK